MIASEQDLAALAGMLIGNADLTARERGLIPQSTTFPARMLDDIRERIRAGHDPLGDLFCDLRSSEARRGQGAVYTPRPIIDAMIAWAVEQAAQPARIVDPGAGSGRFLVKFEPGEVERLSIPEPSA